MKHLINQECFLWQQGAEEMMSTASQVPDWHAKHAASNPGIAIVPISGMIYSGMSGRDEFGNVYAGATTIIPEIEKAVSDESVHTIVLLTNTPGGTCRASCDIGDAVSKAAGKKRVEAFVDGWCCSGGVYITSGAHRITASPSSTLGSVGVVRMAYDTSKYYASMGIEAVALTTGQQKIMGASGVPITEDMRAESMKNLNVLLDDFKSVLRNRRGLSDEQINVLAEKGAEWRSEQAVKMGLADQVTRWDEFVSSLIPPKSKGGGSESAAVKPGGTKMNIIEQIRNACPGASDTFIVQAVASGKEISEVMSDFQQFQIAESKKQNEAQAKQIADLQAKLEAAAKAPAPVQTPPGNTQSDMHSPVGVTELMSGPRISTIEEFQSAVELKAREYMQLGMDGMVALTKATAEAEASINKADIEQIFHDEYKHQNGSKVVLR